jgi:pyridinium-3,5-bisthiocarboxylic acid mononucleotide nickel chelatase
LKIAYFDCFAGVSGDMCLGALVDAGADAEVLKGLPRVLGLHGCEVNIGKSVKRGISATQVTVSAHEHHHHAHHHSRGLPDILAIIDAASLPETAKPNARAIFTKLAEAEANVHNSTIDEVHFHEVGAVDAIVDIVGTCVLLESLGIEEIHCSPLPTFTGTAKSAHGEIPLPAPATVELLKGAPWRQTDIVGELVTPTGAAIVSTLSKSFGTMPTMTVESIGYGSGEKDFGIPNVLRVIIGIVAAGADRGPGADRGQHDVTVIETNIDDLNPQTYEIVMERLFEAGALDVYLTPVQMKKNRPATLLTVVCKPGDETALSRIIFTETSTLGVRIDHRSRLCLDREVVTVDTPYGPIRVKLGILDGETVNASPEYEDCKSAATKHGVPFKVVREAATCASPGKCT